MPRSMALIWATPRSVGVAVLLLLTTWAATPASAQADTVPTSTVMAQLASGEPVIRSMRDRQGISVESVLEELQESKLPMQKGSRTPVTQAAALATLRRITTTTLPAGLPTDPIALRVAATVTALGNVDAAQAILLEAERREPGNLATRISMANLLIAQGYPQEGLALIGPRPPEGPAAVVRGMNLRAGWFLTRGNGLLCGGLHQEAGDPFKEAGKEDPFLSEAARGEAKAHLMQGNRNAARRAIRRASRQPEEPAWDDDAELVEIRYARLYDLGRGQYRALRHIEAPPTPAEVLPFLAELSTMADEVRVAQGEVTQRLTEAANDVLQAGLREGSTPPEPGTASLEVNFQAGATASNILAEQLGITHPVEPWDPTEPAAFSYRAMLPQWEDKWGTLAAIERRDGTLGLRQRDMLRTALRFMDELPRQRQGFHKKIEALPNMDREPWCRAVIQIVTDDLPTANTLFYERDQAIRAWFVRAWYLASAIASHAEGWQHEEAAAQMEASMLVAENSRLVEVGLIYSRYGILEQCRGFLDGSRARERAEERQAQQMLKCDPFLKGMNLKLRVPDVNGDPLFDIKINCEKIQIKGKAWSNGVLALKLGAEWTPGKGGEVTGLIGVSATSGVPSDPARTGIISAGTDLFITVNGTGVTDGGIRVSLDVNLPVGDATGQLSVSGKLSAGEIQDIVSGVNVETVTDLVTGGGVQTLRDAVAYWAP